MDRKEFVDYTKRFLEKKINSLTPRELEVCIHGVVESVLQVIESGEAVRLPPFGTFYPRMVFRPGTRELSSVRVGFNPFTKANQRVSGKIHKLAAFRGQSKSTANPSVEGEGGEEPFYFVEGDEKLYNLSELSRLTNLSYPTTRKYVQENADKIPYRMTATGKKYLPEAVDILLSLRKREPLQREDDGYYTLTDISKHTNISTVTLTSYLERYKLEPAKVDGRGRAFYDAAFLAKVAEIRRTNREQWGS